MILENQHILMTIDDISGAVCSFVMKKHGADMLAEKRLRKNFSLRLRCGGAIDGMDYRVSSARQEGNRAVFCYQVGEISLACTITLDGEKVFFESRMENGGDDVVEELRYPQLGGITNWAGGVSAKMTYAGYLNLPDPVPLFQKFPTTGAGGEPACFALTYPGMMMPWQDIYDEETNTGLYLGYHDETYRFSAWEYVLHPTTSGSAEDSWIRGEEAGGEPSGMVFSHVRCPFIEKGESFCSGKFVLMAHEGDWHQSSLCYREWFLEHFPFEKESHWLRKKTAWFTSIIYQPEDKIVADYNTYAGWCADAANFGVNCYELIGWDKGGLERGYPEYEPARALGGREAFCEMVEKIHKIEGGRLLAFANYNVLDSSTDWFATELNQYVAKDANGHSANWMAWGEGTLSARCQLSVNRHYVASVVPRIQEILEDYLLKVAEDGVDGFQIDKLCVGSILDFNPAQMGKPDTANFEGLVSAIASLYEKAREINPDFCIAAECSQDRMIPYIDVYYRCAWGHMISPLRYVFPEWTACNHMAYPKDYYVVNGSVMTGAVLCIEPQSYQNTMALDSWRPIAAYIREVTRLREELFDYIFMANYLDDQGAKVWPVSETGAKQASVAGAGAMVEADTSDSTTLYYKVHQNNKTGQKAIVVMNAGDQEVSYRFAFWDREGAAAKRYRPFETPDEVSDGETLIIKANGLQILIEK